MEKEIRLFLNSDLDEADYYSLSKENLLTLRQYLLQLKEKDNYFQLSIREQFESIKEKCSWLSEIRFGGLILGNGTYEMSAIYLHSDDEIDLIAVFNAQLNRYEDLTKHVPKIYMLNNKIRKHLTRQNDINSIQEELHVIDDIGRSIYSDVLLPITSISENFKVYYTPQLGMSIYSGYDLIAQYLDCSKKYKDKEFLKDENSKEKLLEKILVKSETKKI